MIEKNRKGVEFSPRLVLQHSPGASETYPSAGAEGP